MISADLMEMFYAALYRLLSIRKLIDSNGFFTTIKYHDVGFISQLQLFQMTISVDKAR